MVVEWYAVIVVPESRMMIVVHCRMNRNELVCDDCGEVVHWMRVMLMVGIKSVVLVTMMIVAVSIDLIFLPVLVPVLFLYELYFPTTQSHRQ